MEFNLMSPNMYNGLSLAYIGDAIYELYIRKYALSRKGTKVKQLHNLVTKFTSAKAQANAVHYLLNNEVLTEEEINIFKRGRNSHVNTSRKNVELATYLDATGFEALMGYLYLGNQMERLNELISIIISIDEEV